MGIDHDMKHIFTFLFLIAMAFSFSACHCKTCSVSLPGGCCEPCPKPPKPLKRPRPKPECHLPVWPDRPVKCVTTQICRKCCHIEKDCTKDGYPFEIEVCEVTYKSLYTDGSTRVWTEVTRNPVTKTPKRNGPNYRNLNHRSGPFKGSIVCNRCP